MHRFFYINLLPRLWPGLIPVVCTLPASLHIHIDWARREVEKSMYRLQKTSTVPSSSFPPEGDLPEQLQLLGKDQS